MKSDITKQIKEKRGNEVCNAYNPKRPWLSTLSYFVLSIRRTALCVYGYSLSGKFSSAKEITNRSEGDFCFE